MISNSYTHEFSLLLPQAIANLLICSDLYYHKSRAWCKDVWIGSLSGKPREMEWESRESETDKKAKLVQRGWIKVTHVGSGNLILLGLSTRHTTVRLVDQRHSGTPLPVVNDCSKRFQFRMQVHIFTCTRKAERAPSYIPTVLGSFWGRKQEIRSVAEAQSGHLRKESVKEV